MRHRKIGRKLNCKSNRRKALFLNLSKELVTHEIIKTTLPKAKELRRIIEPLITFAKVDNLSRRRLAFSKIRTKTIVKKLFDDIGPRFINCPGGYTRILKCGFRSGDQAPMAYIELINRIVLKKKHSN